jgi:hypothetical protein
MCWMQDTYNESTRPTLQSINQLIPHNVTSNTTAISPLLKPFQPSTPQNMSRQEENAIINPEEKDNLVAWLTCIQQKFDEAAQSTATISRLTAKSRDATEACIADVARNTLSTADAVANAAGLLDAVNAELTRGITAGRIRRETESSEEIESTTIAAAGPTIIAAEPTIIAIPPPAESHRLIEDLMIGAVLGEIFWKIHDESFAFAALLFALTGHE